MASEWGTLGRTPRINVGRRGLLCPLLSVLAVACTVTVSGAGDGCFDSYPRQYVAYKLAEGQTIQWDGKLEDAAWTQVPFSQPFQDIATDTRPYLDTHMKMRWDDQCLYVGGRLEEPQAFANWTKNNSIIFYDNDFEVFVDPDGSTHFYKVRLLSALTCVLRMRSLKLILGATRSWR